MELKYFKRYWDEPRGLDETEAKWGCSWWYFEANETGTVERHIEVYDSGPTLRYSRLHPADEFGFLSDKSLDLSEFIRFEIDRNEFESVWAQENK